MSFLTGCRCTSRATARMVASPSTVTLNRVLNPASERSAEYRASLSTETWIGSIPRPYTTAGMRPERLMRRAGRLPASSRGSAASVT